MGIRSRHDIGTQTGYGYKTLSEYESVPEAGSGTASGHESITETGSRPETGAGTRSESETERELGPAEQGSKTLAAEGGPKC